MFSAPFLLPKMTNPDYSKRFIVRRKLRDGNDKHQISRRPVAAPTVAQTSSRSKCLQCGRKARSAEKIQDVLREVLGDRYSFISILGSGGFAEVYKAKDTVLERDVAIKRVRLDNLCRRSTS